MIYSFDESTRGKAKEAIATGKLQGRVEEEGVDVLGTPLTESPEFLRTTVHKALRETAEDVLRLIWVDPHTAAYLYSTCVKPRWVHFERAWTLVGQEMKPVRDCLKGISECMRAHVTGHFDEAKLKGHLSQVARTMRQLLTILPPSRGGSNLALIDDEDKMIAKGLGAYMDVVPYIRKIAQADKQTALVDATIASFDPMTEERTMQLAPLTLVDNPHDEATAAFRQVIEHIATPF